MSDNAECQELSQIRQARQRLEELRRRYEAELRSYEEARQKNIEELQCTQEELRQIYQEQKHLEEERRRYEEARRMRIEEERQRVKEGLQDSVPLFLMINEGSQLRAQEKRNKKAESKAHETFCRLFVKLTSREKGVHFLKTTNLKLKWLPRPELFVDFFENYVSSVDEAKEIVQALVSSLNSTNIICTYESKINNEYMTIVDVIGSPDRSWKEKPSRPMFLKAFKECGVLSAEYISHDVLKTHFGSDYDDFKKPLLHLDFPDQYENEEEALNDSLAEAGTIPEFISMLKTSTFDFSLISDPYHIIECDVAEFHETDAWTLEAALQVAQIFKDRLGVIVINRMDSYFSDEFKTILDTLDYRVANFTYDTSSKVFQLAFEQLGFKRARECNPYVLHQLQVNPGAQQNLVEWNRKKMQFEVCQPHFPILQHEVIMEVFKPMRIQKWLEAGNELEQYCN